MAMERTITGNPARKIKQTLIKYGNGRGCKHKSGKFNKSKSNPLLHKPPQRKLAPGILKFIE